MLRILTFIVFAVVFYFGTVFLIEFRNPGVQDLSSVVPDHDPNAQQDDLGLPDFVLGQFLIDKQSSHKWILGQKALKLSTAETFSDRQKAQHTIGFNGKDIWFSDRKDVLPVKILEVTDKLVSFQVLDETKPFTAFLQWDGKGAVWYSDYTHKQYGKLQLYRACYRKK